MRILLVDDDEALMDLLAERLIKQRYAVDIAADGRSAEEWLALFSYDCIVLDRQLPDIEGIALCQRFRQQGVTAPILMLTAKDDTRAKVQALDAGADDYVVKPFDFDELCARIRALLRRESAVLNTVLQRGELKLNPNTFEVFYGQHQLHMTPKEYALLELFLRHPNQVFSLDAIIDNLWSLEDPPSGDAVRTHVKGLRQKLKAGGAPKDYVETVYGLGYRLKPEEEEASQPAAVVRKPRKGHSQPEIIAAVAAAWEKHQDTMQERLSVLEATATALQEGQLSAELQSAGRSQAHKLAGSMGCFGFSEGSRLARELEHLLQLEAPLNNQQAAHFSALVKNLRQNLDKGTSRQVVSAAMSGAPQLLTVGVSDPFCQQLEAEALTAGLRLAVVQNASEAVAALQGGKPHAIAAVFIWLAGQDLDQLLPLLKAIEHHPEDIPVLVVTDIQDFQQRLQLVQQGVAVILETSTTARHAIETVKQTLHSGLEASRVMIVDDDAQVLELLEKILSPWGFQLTTLSNPADLLGQLEAVKPDLLLMDVEMPEVNGLEICRVLRADERWRKLPILFLTVHEDLNTQHQAFNVGADDFICKSVMATELPTRLLNRLKRSGKTPPTLSHV